MSKIEHRSSGPKPATRLMEIPNIHLLQNLLDLWLDKKMPSFNVRSTGSATTHATSLFTLRIKISFHTKGNFKHGNNAVTT